MSNEKLEINEFFKKLGFKDDNINLRQKCMENFLKDGFPSKKHEDWKFFDFDKIILNEIPNLNFFNDAILKDLYYADKIQKLGFSIKEYNHIIFVNGFIQNIELNHEDQNKIEVIRNNSIDTVKNESLINLNNALSYDYIKLLVKDKYIFNKPLLILSFSNDLITNINFNSRIDIEMEKNSILSMADINFHNSKKNFFNLNKNIKLAEGSILKNYILDPFNNENLHYTNTKIDLEGNSVAENFILSSGSNFSKNEIICNLKEQYSSAFVNGIINLNNNKKHEIRTKISHLSENTKSYQLVKCALKDEAKAVYQGKIFVDQVAQKTDGYQSSKAVLLDKATEFNCKPELEIYADDVKCSHGSSSGNLDENKIFYLMTRGLNKLEAKKILLDGYFLEVIEKITDNEIKKITKILMGIKWILIT